MDPKEARKFLGKEPHFDRMRSGGSGSSGLNAAAAPPKWIQNKPTHAPLKIMRQTSSSSPCGSPVGSPVTGSPLSGGFSFPSSPLSQRKLFQPKVINGAGTQNPTVIKPKIFKTMSFDQ